MKKNVRLALKGEMVLSKLPDYRKSLEKVLESEVDLLLDLAGISQIDAAGLQFLISFSKTRQSAGRETSFSYETNPLVREVFRLSGAEKIL